MSRHTVVVGYHRHPRPLHLRICMPPAIGLHRAVAAAVHAAISADPLVSAEIWYGHDAVSVTHQRSSYDYRDTPTDDEAISEAVLRAIVGVLAPIKPRTPAPSRPSRP